MWFYAKSHLSNWRAIIWLGHIASFLPGISSHLLKEREERSFTECFTNTWTMFWYKGPGCLFTICCKWKTPPEKLAPWAKQEWSPKAFSYLYMEQFFLSRLKVKRQGYKSCTQLPSPHSLPSKRTCELRMRITATHSALILWVAKCRAVALQLSKRCKEWNKNPQRNIFCICTSRKILSICV